MTFKGCLSQFTLPEVFRFLEEGQKKGLLTIRTSSPNQRQEMQSYYIWLLQGRVVAAADRLDGLNLTSIIIQRGFLNASDAAKISEICPRNTPLGLSLKSQGILQADQLTLLFRNQVIKPVSALLQLKDGKFDFDPTANLLQAEITGLSMPATEVILMGLRTLPDWTALAEKLPDPGSSLLKKTQGQSQVQLSALERQVWELANGTFSLQKIAKQLGHPREKVQQVAFCLMTANLVEETFLIDAALDSAPDSALLESTNIKENLSKPAVETFSKNNYGQLRDEKSPSANGMPKQLVETFSTPMASKSSMATSPTRNSSPSSSVESAGKPQVSQSFLQNLVGFLRNKI